MKVIELQDPIHFGAEIINEVSIPVIKTKHIRGISNLNEMGTDEMLKLLSNITNMPDSQLDELSIRDLIQLSEVISDFLDSSPETGKSL